ncbi:hypothetical protein [Paracoccus sp. (in: a-proteobacteria)]|uniref:hypothetical protein n=1 Tax=Paracoccus sp. TaxID=267 RepID=UPI002896DE14|nr:hypothetical protein [Paracoccus sp. (in: a-proteobacteria)]
MQVIAIAMQKGGVERVAILRARLDMTNSGLIEYALNELWARHESGRKFGD